MTRHVSVLCALAALLLALTACGGADGLTPVVGLPPTITSISPSQGLTTGGATVTITGTNFTSLIVVSIGGNLCLNVSTSGSTSLTCVTPQGTQGAKDVQVSTATGSDTLPGGYSYVLAPLRRPPGSEPEVNVTALNADGEAISILFDILNLECDGSVFIGDVPFSALEPVASGAYAGRIHEAAGFYFGVEPQSGVVFWYDDVAKLLLGSYPDGWCLDTQSAGAVSLSLSAP